MCSCWWPTEARAHRRTLFLVDEAYAEFYGATAIRMAVRLPNMLVVKNSLPVKNVAEFVAYVKANPGKVNLASSGNGTSVHLSGEMFMAMTGVKMQHVPYRGAAPAITDMLGGQVQLIFDNLPSALEQVRGGGWPSTFRVPSPKEHMLPDPENPARVTATGLGKIAPVELLESFAEIIKNGDLCADVIEDIGLQIHNHRMGAPGN